MLTNQISSKKSYKKPKVLFLSTNRIYFNNTLQLFPLAIARFSEVEFYGPGFQSNDILNEGIDYFVNKKGPFDLLITDAVIFFYKNDEPLYGSYNYFPLNDQTKQIIISLKNYFLESNQIKLLYTNIDFYNVNLSDIELLIYSKTFLLTWGPELLEYSYNCEYLIKENFVNKVNDNWIHFILKYKHRVISLPQIISESEFQFLPTMIRKYDVSVPGANYFFRKSVIQIIKNTKEFKLDNSNSGFLQSLYYRLYLQIKTRFSNVILNKKFQNTLEDSKVVITCGSALKYVVRKYFEIPASGALLMCYPCKGFAELGFINNQNCIIINSPFDVNILLSNILKDSNSLQLIAKNGQKLVWEKHSFHARSAQLEIAILAILENNFYGSFWSNGVFNIITK